MEEKRKISTMNKKYLWDDSANMSRTTWYDNVHDDCNLWWFNFEKLKVYLDKKTQFVWVIRSWISGGRRRKIYCTMQFSNAVTQILVYFLRNSSHKQGVDFKN
jgi:hypothetical protein